MSRSTLSASTLLLALSSLFVALPGQAQTADTYACVDTNKGEFCMKFLRENAPNTVDNFLKYVNSGAFNGSFFHRNLYGEVIQGGGYKLNPLGEQIPEEAQVANEFSASNVRGTVAMAKLPNQPDSATNEWFVNVRDNSDTLDVDNGGYTVFARIVKGMALVDYLNSRELADLSSSLGDAFGFVPVLRKDADGVGLEDLVQIERVYTTDFVEEEPLDSGPTEEELEELYQCTAGWIRDIAPREVCMETNVGNFCMDLMPEAAPNTVANFLHYVADGDYDNTFIHLSEKDVVIQGGGFRTSPIFSPVPTDDPVDNEYGTPNTRGTVALAKLGNDPDSGDSQWFINLADNAQAFGSENNGGYTVFARVHEADMTVVDAIANLEVRNLSVLNNNFDSAPMINVSNPNGLSVNDLVVVKRAYIPGHEVNSCLPVEPEATTKFDNRTFTLPVRVNGMLYEFQFMQGFEDDDEYTFSPVTWNIRSLNDVGQEAAEYSSETRELFIPSVYWADQNVVLRNVRLALTDPQALEFTLVRGAHSTDPPATVP